MPVSPGPAKTLNRNELAAFHGVTVPLVDSWVKHGCPALERGSKGKAYRFDSAAVIAWRIEKARTDAIAGLVTEGGEMSREEADRRRAVIGARLAEIDLDERLKAVVAAQHVDDDLTAFCNALHVAMDNASHKIADRTSSITNAPEIREVCHTELNRALNSSKLALAEKWAKGA